MDAVDRALSSVRAIDSMVGRTLAEPPWGLVLDTDAPCVLAAVLHGEAWVTHADAEPLRVGRGEIVTACGHAPLVIGHQPGAAIDVVVTDRDVCYDPVSGADLSESCRIGGRTFGRPDGSVSVLVAAFHADSEVYWLLERVLPRMLHVPATEQLARLLAVLEAETDVERPGHQVAVDRLMELLLISTVRAWLDGDGQGCRRGRRHSTTRWSARRCGRCMTTSPHRGRWRHWRASPQCHGRRSPGASPSASASRR